MTKNLTMRDKSHKNWLGYKSIAINHQDALLPYCTLISEKIYEGSQQLPKKVKYYLWEKIKNL